MFEHNLAVKHWSYHGRTAGLVHFPQPCYMEKKRWLERLASDSASRSLSSPGDVCRQHTDHYTVELLAAVLVNINFVASNKVEQNELGMLQHFTELSTSFAQLICCWDCLSSQQESNKML